MKWLVLVRPLAIAAVAFCVGPVSAQTTTGTTTGLSGATGTAFGNNIEQVRIGTRGSTEKEKVDPDANVFISEDECELYFDVEFNAIASRVNTMELWVSLDASTDCSTPAARAVTTAGTPTICWRAGTARNLQGKDAAFTDIAGTRIFDQERSFSDDQEPEPGAQCPDGEANNVPYYLWFVPLNSPTIAQSSTPPTAIGAPYRIRLNLFTVDPAAPANVSTSGGESAIKVKWDSVADRDIRYRAFFDVRPDGDCATSVFYDVAEDGTKTVKRGADLVVDDVSLFRSGVINKTSASFDLNKKDIPFGSKIAVSVASQDLAGNIGTLSAPQCVERIETTSAIEACGTPEECGLETCGLSPASRGGWFGLSLFGLLLAALIRRRTA